MSYRVIVKQGNLVKEENANFIVNASNTKLLLGSGVSMALKRHCGIELQEEMTFVFEEMLFDIEQGDVTMTSSAKANNFDFVLHAMIMNYNKGVRGSDKNPTIKTIEKSLFEIEGYLLAYLDNKLDTNKLVLPLLGCGVGGLGKKDVINLYNNFFSRYIEIDCTVVIYGYTQEDYELIGNIFSLNLNLEKKIEPLNNSLVIVESLK